MSRTLKVLFRRDPSKDRKEQKIHYEGYSFFWPDGRPVTVGLNAFCQHGQRLFGLGRHLAGCRERFIELVCVHLRDGEDDLTRLPGARVRRFFLQRNGRLGRVHFMDGTPTAIALDLDHDEPRVLHWIGLLGLREGERQWFDLAARPAEAPAVFANR